MTSNPAYTPLLDVRGLSVRFGPQRVLDAVDLRLAPGELVGLIGPNGSGKSTLMRSLAGLLMPASGTIHIAGHDLATQALAARAAFGYAVEPATLPALLSGRQCMELVAQTRGIGEVPAGSRALADSLALSPWLAQPVATYSLGTRQKLAIVLALLGEPPLLLLDEVLNGLDPLAAFALKQALVERARAGAAVLIATHGLEVAERFLDRALLLLDGRLVADWDAAALAEFRRRGDGLEGAVIQTLKAERARATPR
jgi:ABC-2 type transport system ATP-binding protein